MFVTKNTSSRASSLLLCTHTSKVDRLTRRVGSLSKDNSCKDTIYILKSKRDKYWATHAARIWVNFLDALATKQLREKSLRSR